MRDLTAASRLQAIDLARLDTIAPLLTRKDRKYVVPTSLVEELISSQDLMVLEIDGLRSFRYESVYFDTPDRVSYRDAAHKRRRRFKVRTRSYLDTETCLLEVKTRQRRGLTRKNRMPYPFNQRTELTAEGIRFVEQFDEVAPFGKQLSPSLTTRYSRTTFLEPASGSRVTVDFDLECETPEGDSLRLPDLAVVETKTNGQACSVDHFLWGKHHRPVSISKYGTGLAALDPKLPANKWSRVLRTYFKPAEARAVGTRTHDRTLERLTARPASAQLTPRHRYSPSVEGVQS